MPFGFGRRAERRPGVGMPPANNQYSASYYGGAGQSAANSRHGANGGGSGAYGSGYNRSGNQGYYGSGGSRNAGTGQGGYSQGYGYSRGSSGGQRSGQSGGGYTDSRSGQNSRNVINPYGHQPYRDRQGNYYEGQNRWNQYSNPQRRRQSAPQNNRRHGPEYTFDDTFDPHYDNPYSRRDTNGRSRQSADATFRGYTDDRRSGGSGGSGGYWNRSGGGHGYGRYY